MTHLISYDHAGDQIDISWTTLNWRALLALCLNVAAWAGMALLIGAVV